MSFERHSPKIMIARVFSGSRFRRIRQDSVSSFHRRYVTARMHADASRSSGSLVSKLRFSALLPLFFFQIPRDTECRHTGTFGRKCYRPCTDLHDMIIFLDIAGGRGGEMTGAVATPVIPNTYTAAHVSLCIRACERYNRAITGLC